MTTSLIILWLLAGAVAVWRAYHGALKDWYESFGESYWDFHKREGFSAIAFMLITSPILITTGLLGLLLFEALMPKNCWYFKTPEKK